MKFTTLEMHIFVNMLKALHLQILQLALDTKLVCSAQAAMSWSLRAIEYYRQTV